MPVHAPGHTGASHSTASCLCSGRAEGARSDSLLSPPQTRVLVTHGISFLPQTDFIIVLADGRVSEVGTYTALLQRNDSFANFLRNYTLDDSGEHLEEDSRASRCHPWPCMFLRLPSVSSVSGPLSVSGQAQCCTREVLGNLDHLCGSQTSPRGKGKQMWSAPSSPSSLTG